MCCRGWIVCLDVSWTPFLGGSICFKGQLTTYICLLIFSGGFDSGWFSPPKNRGKISELKSMFCQIWVGSTNAWKLRGLKSIQQSLGKSMGLTLAWSSPVSFMKCHCSVDLLCTRMIPNVFSGFRYSKWEKEEKAGLMNYAGDEMPRLVINTGEIQLQVWNWEDQTTQTSC